MLPWEVYAAYQQGKPKWPCVSLYSPTLFPPIDPRELTRRLVARVVYTLHNIPYMPHDRQAVRDTNTAGLPSRLPPVISFEASVVFRGASAQGVI